eukprot:TRINITY_DN3451_c0_g1_i2.p2 TRINITY_DN3451_c0_g1~~TRINITY_DN3451_c0_g1_i2.p2  ORF type:complete len:100 (-),score=31.55 TRINITY_DN3451_c0_g1_i2:42-341(-)
MSLFFFFFQAEDGIRDHAQSRGLGDVYKRQVHGIVMRIWDNFLLEGEVFVIKTAISILKYYEIEPVSYTHLTLPTICSVQISVVAVSLKKKKHIIFNIY